MDNKVLFIGKFNDTTKNLQQFLKRFMTIQLCSDNVNVATNMIQIYGPQVILMNLEDFDASHEGIFNVIEEKYQDVPVVTIGTEEQQSPFASFYGGSQYTHIVMPTVNDTILDTLTEKLGLDDGDTVENQGPLPLVLLVDDSPVLLRSMKHMLEEKYRIAMATSGEQAMEMIGKEVPQIIILDYEMPGCDGKETLEMIRQNEATVETPVVFLTGHGDADHIRSVLDLNPSAYFLKPPKAEKIHETLEQILAKEYN